MFVSNVGTAKNYLTLAERVNPKFKKLFMGSSGNSTFISKISVHLKTFQELKFQITG